MARLGWFVELEILAENPDEEYVARAESALRETLARCGVPESAIERRFYTEMLSALEGDDATGDEATGDGTRDEAADFHVPAK